MVLSFESGDIEVNPFAASFPAILVPSTRQNGISLAIDEGGIVDAASFFRPDNLKHYGF